LLNVASVFLVCSSSLVGLSICQTKPEQAYSP
jgi:hypothetical protein